MQQQKSLDVELWSNLPSELLERVLPFLPVPDLCRFRSVCKRWSTLIATPEFGTLTASHSLHSQSSAYLVVKLRVIYTNNGRSKDVPSWSIFDLQSRRWYTLKNEEWSMDSVAAMDGGLVCTPVNVFTEDQLQASTIDNATHPQALIVANLLSNRVDRVLPNPPLARIDLCWLNLKLIMDSVDHFTVFLVCVGSFWNQLDPCMAIYDSGTNQWRNPPNPPVSNVGTRVRTVIYRGVFYVLFSNAEDGVIHSLCGYNAREDAWIDTGVEFRGSKVLDWCELVVSDDRLFLTSQRSVKVVYGKKRVVSYPLDVSEILISEKRCRIVAKMRHRWSMAKISAFGFEQGIVFLCQESGKMMQFHLRSRVWENLPSHPLEQSILQSSSSKSSKSARSHGKLMSFLRLPNTPWG